MAKAFLVTEDAWNRLVADHQRLRSQHQNLRNQRVGPRHNAGGGARMIEFTLTEELRRGQTKKATHLPWMDGADPIRDLEVEETGKIPSELRAPPGTTGLAMRVPGPNRWVIITLDCEALEPHDGDPQDEGDDGEDDAS